MYMTAETANVTRNDESIEVVWNCGTRNVLPNLWLRDNCECHDCRVSQTGEKKFMITDVSADLVPDEVDIANDCLRIVWPDEHESYYDGKTLRMAGGDRKSEWSSWSPQFVPQRFAFREFLDNDDVAAAAISVFVDKGVFILDKAPDVSGTLEQLAPRLGPVRELLFDRIHDVEVDPSGYNVAHTSLPLPPHNDFASYSWPPSVQALHMLANETPGGESIVVDGWSVLGALRDEHPDYFASLCTMPVPFREYDDMTETWAVAPLVRCDADGRIDGFRYSNQLMQAVDPNDPRTPVFYRAYHELCQRITDRQARSTFRLHGGEVLIVASHRVLHGREAFEPTGRRHLQDAYFELDNVRNHLHVLQRNGGN